jgi:hypothetical protein
MTRAFRDFNWAATRSASRPPVITGVSLNSCAMSSAR